MIRLYFGLSLIIASSVANAATKPTGAREFANHVVKYVLSDSVDMSSEEYLGRFAPRLRAAIVADMKKSFLAFGEESRSRHRGYLRSAYGLLDNEPICLCQFGRGVRILIRSVNTEKNGAVVATEVRDVAGASSSVTWHLVRTRHGWTISDIEEPSAGFPSLLAALERHNKGAR
jgi:hypothetical protein